MNNHLSFQFHNFEGYCQTLKRVGIDAGYVMYTNHHASNDKPAARLISGNDVELAKAYIGSPSDEIFRQLVEAGALFDTDWDRRTHHWELIAFEGWETLHKAFAHLQVKASQSLMELTGLSDREFIDSI